MYLAWYSENDIKQHEAIYHKFCYLLDNGTQLVIRQLLDTFHW